MAHGSSKRTDLVERGGQMLVPYLIDPNTDTEMYESDDIIDYLRRTYGSTARARTGRASSRNHTSGVGMASILRPEGSQTKVRRDRSPEKLIELYGFEASPHCRKVREALNELDLDYHVRNVAEHSARRPELTARGGEMKVPYLVDPNTGTEMYESADIVRYLWQTYG